VREITEGFWEKEVELM